MKEINYNEEDIRDHHGVAAIIKNEKGKILMQLHAKYGFWTIPVGKVKNEQSIQDGLKQEIFEECNITIQKFKEIIAKDYFYNRNGNKVKVISHLFEVVKYTGTIKNNEPQKHKKQIFMSLKEITTCPYLSDLTILYLETQGIKREPKI